MSCDICGKASDLELCHHCIALFYGIGPSASAPKLRRPKPEPSHPVVKAVVVASFVVPLCALLLLSFETRFHYRFRVDSLYPVGFLAILSSLVSAIGVIASGLEKNWQMTAVMGVCCCLFVGAIFLFLVLFSGID